MPEPVKYFGKYRGTVVTNADPMRMGRIQAQVPDVLGDATSSWAMPAVPLAGPQVGQYVIPPVGAGVWVEFEQGNKSYPIWSGCWWGSQAEVPRMALTGSPSQPNIVLQTPGEHIVLLSDQPGGPGITLKTASGASLVINDTGIVISNGKGASISLIGDTVTINDGAFAVT